MTTERIWIGVLAEKVAEVERLRTRCCTLESLLGAAISLGYIDEKACSSSWLEEVHKEVR